MRLIVARCQVSYAGRLQHRPARGGAAADVKADGTFMVWADGGGSNVKPLNWMAAPTVIEEELDEDGGLQRLLVRKRGQEDRLEIAVAEVLSDVEHELDTQATLEKEGRRARAPGAAGRTRRSGVGRGCGWSGASGPPTSGPWI